MVSYYLLKAISAIVCLLPRGFAEVLGLGLGNFAWLVIPRKRKVLAHDQIVACLGVTEKEAERKIVDWDRTYFLTKYYCI